MRAKILADLRDGSTCLSFRLARARCRKKIRVRTEAVTHLHTLLFRSVVVLRSVDFKLPPLSSWAMAFDSIRPLVRCRAVDLLTRPREPAELATAMSPEAPFEASLIVLACILVERRMLVVVVMVQYQGTKHDPIGKTRTSCDLHTSVRICGWQLLLSCRYPAQARLPENKANKGREIKRDARPDSDHRP